MASVMNFCESLGFLTLALILVAAPGSATFSVELSSGLLQVGENLEMKCRITSTSPGETWFWVKRQGSEADNDIISIGPAITSPFESLGRFSLEGQDEGTDFISVLTITGVEYVDSGEYGCVVARSAPDIVSEEIAWVPYITADPVKEVRMFGLLDSDTDDIEEKKIEFTDGEEVMLPDEGQYYIRCEFYGSNPVAAVTVTFGEEDITNKFEKEDSERTEEGPNQDLNHMNYLRNDVVVTTIRPLQVDTSHRHHKLTCTGLIEGQDPLSISVTPVMAVETEMKCPQVRLAFYYEKDLVLTCNVTARPPIVSGRWSWLAHGGQLNETLDIGSQHAAYSAYKGELVGDAQSFSLKIKFVAENMFHHYVLTLTDENGHQHSGKILLDRDPADASRQRAAGLSSLSHCLLAVVLFLAYRFIS